MSTPRHFHCNHRTLSMLTLLILAFVLEFSGSGCANQSDEKFVVSDFESMGLFLFSVNDFGYMHFSGCIDEAVAGFVVCGWLGIRESVDEMLALVAGPQTGWGGFRSPDFDWKEKQDELFLNVFMFKNAQTAQRLASVASRRIKIYQNGRFLLLPGNAEGNLLTDKYTDSCITAFAGLVADEFGNLHAPLLEKSYDINVQKDDETGSESFWYSEIKRKWCQSR